MSKVYKIKELQNKLKNKKFSLVHGVFDVIHVGHKKHFDVAKSYSNFLVVSITSDKYVRKGPGRPFFNQNLRAEMLSSFENIDAVIINDDVTSINLINKIKPKYYFKGSDYKNYSNDVTKNIQKEKKAVEKNGGKLIITEDIQFSSSKIINSSFAKIDLDKINVSNLNKFKISCNNALDSIKNLKVCIIGEMIFDKYVYCTELEKPSKEMIQAVERKNEKLYLGGSFAIARNISDFCKSVDLFLAGNFTKTSKFLKKQKPKNINLKIFNNDYNIITKTRYINFTGRKLFELYERDGNLKKLYCKKFESKLKNSLRYYDLVILADFGHGLINDNIINIIQENSKFLSINAQTNADNRGFNLITKYKKADSIVIDQPEIRLALSDKDSDVSTMSDKLMNEINTRNLMITMGKDGMHLTTKLKKKKLKYKLNAFELTPLDTMGAGDAVFGISSLLFKKKIDPKVIIFISNIFGSLATKILGHENYIKKIEVEKSIQYLLK